jgi:hypothetical protein
MKKEKTCENFPLKIVLLANAFSLLIYGFGALILSGFGAWAIIVYLLYCLAMEINVMKRSCVHCYYYGKICGLGKGKLCAKFFKKGNPKKFGKEGVNILKLIPDFLVFILPLVGGIILLIKDFNWALLGAMIVIVLLSSVGNAVIRGNYVCKFCRQRLLTCPAEKFFNRK